MCSSDLGSERSAHLVGDRVDELVFHALGLVPVSYTHLELEGLHLAYDEPEEPMPVMADPSLSFPGQREASVLYNMISTL